MWVRRRFHTWYICERIEGTEVATRVGYDESQARDLAAAYNITKRGAASADELAAALEAVARTMRADARSIVDLVDDYLAAKRPNVADSTYAAYRRYLDAFAAAFADVDWRGLTLGRISRWIDSTPSPDMVRRALKPFGRYCHEERAWPDGPLLRIRVPATRARTRTLTAEQVAAAEEALAGDEVYGPFLAGVYAGLRADEVAHARLEHLDRAARTLFIGAWEGWHPKNRRERTVPLAPKLLAAIPEGDRGWAFMRMDGQPWTRHTFRKHLAALTGWTPHLLRHTCSSLLQMRGVPPSVVRDILGHSSVTMTNRYTHTVDRALLEAVERL